MQQVILASQYQANNIAKLKGKVGGFIFQMSGGINFSYTLQTKLGFKDCVSQD